MADPQDYIEDVKRYAADANLDHVKKIVNYCGIALRSLLFRSLRHSSKKFSATIID